MAGRIPQHFIDELLNRTDIVDLIDSYVPLKKAGANYKACCPFHGEKTPSFTVSPTKQFYHCFGCGVNGTAITFLMEYDHMEFREAVETLASSAGMEIPEEATPYKPKNTQNAGVDLYKLMESVEDYYQAQLMQHADKEQAIAYLKQRGLSGDIAKRFGLGFAPEGWSNLMDRLGDTVPTQKALIDTGMLSKNDKGRVYDRFRHRIMFPIHDHRGRVVGFGGRVLAQKESQPGNPKYLNSPETPIFHKGAELYGLFGARGAIKEADCVLVVEGYMDVVALAQAGINNAVATLGTATTPMHLQRLFRHTANITFSFDGDRAGRAAAWKALEICLPSLEDGHQVSFLFLPDGEDPDTMVKKVGKQGFKELLANAMPLPEFLLESLKQQADLNRLDGRAKLGKLAKPLLETMKAGVLKALVVERVSALTQVDPIELLGKQADQANYSDTGGDHWRNKGRGTWSKKRAKQRAPSPKSLTPIRRAVSLLLQFPKYHAEFELLKPIKDSQVRGIGMIHELNEVASQTNNPSTAMLLERYRGEAFAVTLNQLANHQHNNIEQLTDEEALDLIRANNAKIVEEFNAGELIRAERALEALNRKSKLDILSDDEKSRQTALKEYIRDCYSL
ncbi:MAG: DNA primase [Gammaproteobacteria bacterium]|nr:DNA primase [Gammaproteobacteria bacterium]